MKLETGKFYKTRDGSKAQWLGITPGKSLFKDSEAAAWILDEDSESWVLRGYRKDGTFYDNAPYPLDIVEEWREPIKLEYWVNIFPSDVCMFYRSKEEAEASAKRWNDCIACIYVSGTEGVEP